MGKVINLRKKEKTVTDILKNVTEKYPNATKMVVVVFDDENNAESFYTADSYQLALASLMVSQLAMQPFEVIE